MCLMKKWPEGTLFLINTDYVVKYGLCYGIFYGRRNIKSKKQNKQHLILHRTDYPGILVFVQWKLHDFQG